MCHICRLAGDRTGRGGPGRREKNAEGMGQVSHSPLNHMFDHAFDQSCWTDYCPAFWRGFEGGTKAINTVHDSTGPRGKATIIVCCSPSPPPPLEHKLHIDFVYMICSTSTRSNQRVIWLGSTPNADLVRGSSALRPLSDADSAATNRMFRLWHTLYLIRVRKPVILTLK